MVQNICLLFSKHAKVGVVVPLDDSASPHGVEAPTSGKEPLTIQQGNRSSSLFPALPSLQVSSGGPNTLIQAPQTLILSGGPLSIGKKKKDLGETSEKTNKVTSIGRANMRFPNPMSNLEEISQIQDSVNDQDVENGYPIVNNFPGIKGQSPRAIVIKRQSSKEINIKSSEKLRSTGLRSMKPRKSAPVKPRNSPMIPNVQNPD